MYKSRHQTDKSPPSKHPEDTTLECSDYIEFKSANQAALMTYFLLLFYKLLNELFLMQLITV